MDDAGKVTETCEDDVNAESRCATDLEEDTKRGEDDGENDFANITCGERHDGRMCWVVSLVELCGW